MVLHLPDFRSVKFLLHIAKSIQLQYSGFSVLHFKSFTNIMLRVVRIIYSCYGRTLFYTLIH